MNETFCSIPLSQLTAGFMLNSPVFEAGERSGKLLGRGIRLTHERIERLRRRGIENVSVSLRDLAAVNLFKPQGIAQAVPQNHRFPKSRIRTDDTDQLDAQVEAGYGLDIEPVGDGLVDELSLRRIDFYDPTAVRQLMEQFRKNLEYLDELYQAFLLGSPPDIAGLEWICRRSLQAILVDKDMFACLSINPFGADYPIRHGLHMASLAMAVGAQMGLDDANLVDLGIGCLIHDLGMLRVDARIHEKTQRLDKRDLAYVVNHPIYTLDFLGAARVNLSSRSMMVAYQIHERCNGSGYPRQRTADQIHELAKIAAVADVYIGLVAQRSFRKGMQPYRAIEKLLEDMREGLYDPAVIRALLNTISLFPLGSYVQTNQGQKGRVIRMNKVSFDRPVIEIWKDGHRLPQSIDLASETDLQIVKTTAKMD